MTKRGWKPRQDLWALRLMLNICKYAYVSETGRLEVEWKKDPPAWYVPESEDEE